MPIRKIAFLGTGIMGAPMACHLARAGYVVTAWNRTAAKAFALESEGVHASDEPGKAVQDADAVITMLTDGVAVGEVLFDLGCAKAAPRDTLFIDSSSIAPALAREHADRLLALGHSSIDAPVSGGESGARAASLAIMAGGGTATFERALPVLSNLGRVTRVGPSGTGQLAKLANQAIVGITIAAVSEALLLTAAGGADPAAFRDAVSGGFASSRVLDEHGKRM
ncbi:MAG: NAD(P)-dependent oxidoreductase, partial [Rhizobiales bacterium]|nr:NAD(P)-dependent oxidoreductase [Hyphomicrobiales bacterium]